MQKLDLVDSEVVKRYLLEMNAGVGADDDFA